MQRRFVAGIVRGLTGKAAAIQAGYSFRTAESQASQLLKLPQVSAAVANAEARALEVAELSAAQIKRDLYAVHLEARAARQYRTAVAALGELLETVQSGRTDDPLPQRLKIGGQLIEF
jgi:phage terminase small subunit